MLTLCLAALFFPASADGCVRIERSHLQSPGTPTGSKVSTGSHFFYFFVVFFMIQSMANRNKNGDRRHPCLNPVFTMKESVSCPTYLRHIFISVSYQRYKFKGYPIVL